MPTLPLYQTPIHPNAWHRVIAPGGHECWHFDATDAASGVRVTVEFVDGDVLDPTYRRACESFLRRPTRTAPPMPRDFPCVRVSVLNKDGTSIWAGNPPFPPGSFTGRLDRAEISIGEGCTMRCDDAGEITILIRDLSSVETDALRLSLQLRFRPAGLISSEFARSAPDGSHAVHFRLVPCERYDVTGEAEMKRKDGTTRTIQFSGPGHHEHVFATGMR